jgi:hypothetical protein
MAAQKRSGGRDKPVDPATAIRRVREYAKRVANAKREAKQPTAQLTQTRTEIVETRGLIFKKQERRESSSVILEGWKVWEQRTQTEEYMGSQGWWESDHWIELWLTTTGELMRVSRTKHMQHGPHSEEVDVYPASDTDLRSPDQYWKEYRPHRQGDHTTTNYGYDEKRPRFKKPCLGLSLALKQLMPD